MCIAWNIPTNIKAACRIITGNCRALIAFRSCQFHYRHSRSINLCRLGRIPHDPQVHRRRCILYEIVPPDTVNPWCTLIFNYRQIGYNMNCASLSLADLLTEVLQEQGIVPYVQSPSGDFVALHRQREEYTEIYEPMHKAGTRDFKLVL
jgi:hypothetical protein